MRVISHYVPPSTEDLKKLKNSLNYTGEQMAELAGISSNNQWRKYTSGELPREMNPHILFFIAARLSLSKKDIRKVLDKMHEIGADFT